MSFRNRLLSLLAAALILAFSGLAYTLLALNDIRDRFTTFVDQDLASLDVYETLYAQGLQSGQALRNIVLDFGNKKGHENLQASLKAMDTAFVTGKRLAETRTELASLMTELEALHLQRQDALNKVLKAAETDRSAAIEALNNVETPTWRVLRKRLIEIIDASKKETEVHRDQAVARAEQATWIAAVLVLLSLLAAGYMIRRLLQSLHAELGGEPALANASMQRIAAGDLTVQIPDVPATSLLGTLNTTTNALRGMVMSIEQQALSLSEKAEHIRHESVAMANDADVETQAATSMAATIEEFAASAGHISHHATDTQTDSQNAFDLACLGQGHVQAASGKISELATTVSSTSDKIRALDQRALQISAIAAAIKDIASQTNLLALNAAIEAARAGEQGRGFAVVADEVRKLAERTAAATVEIDAMIIGIQEDTMGAVQAMEATLPEVESGARLSIQAAESLDAIRDGATRTLQRVAEMVHATQEQSTASMEVAQQVERIAAMVDNTSHMIRDTAQTANELEQVAVSLRQQIERFKV